MIHSNDLYNGGQDFGRSAMKRASGINPILLTGILVFLILITGIYAVRTRQVLLLTDPIWNELYLQDQVKEQDLTGTLLKRGYLLRTKEVSIAIDIEAVEPALENSTAGILLLSPAVSDVFSTLYREGELEELNYRRGLRSIIVFGNGTSGEEGGSRSPNTGRGPVVRHLLITTDGLLSELEELLDQSSPEEEEFSRIYILRSRNSFVPEQVIDGAGDLMRSRFPSASVTVFTSLSEFEKVTIGGNTLVLLLPGFGSDNKRILDNLNRQGGRAIAAFDSRSLTAWPDTVLGAVEFDLKSILIDALERSDQRDSDRLFPIPFTVRK